MVIGPYKTIDQITDEKRLYCRSAEKGFLLSSSQSLQLNSPPNPESLRFVDVTTQVFYDLPRPWELSSLRI